MCFKFKTLKSGLIALSLILKTVSRNKKSSPFILAVIGFLTVLVLGCSNEEKSNSSINVNLSYNTKCLDGFSERWSAWSKGQGDAQLISKDMNCLSDGIEYFLKRVVGSDLDLYTSNEVYHFVSKFFNSNEFDQAIINDLFEIKSWVIGGSKYFISRREFEKVALFIQELKPVFAELTPVANKLFLKSRASEQQIKFSLEESTYIRSRIGLVIERLNKISVKPVTAASKERAYQVLSHMADKFEFNFVEEDEFRSYWNLITLALGQENDTDIALTPYSKIYRYIEKIYFLCIRLKFGVLDAGWRNPTTFEHLEPIVDEGIPLIEDFINNQPNQVLKKNQLIEALDVLAQVLEKENELNLDIRTLVVDRVYSNFFAISDNLTVNEFKKLKVEWDEFRNFQNNTKIFYGRRFESTLITQNLVENLSEKNRDAIDFLWPTLSDENGYILTDLKPKSIEVNYGNMFKLNWQRALSRMFLVFYTTEAQRKKDLTGVTIAELQTGFADVFEVLKSFDVLAETDEKSWFRIFNEANLFVPRATPDEYLSYVEGIDYFAILFSGFEFSALIRDSVDLACVSNPGKACALEWLKNSKPQFWAPLIPKFGDYLSNNLSAADWAEWSEGVEEIIRGNTTSTEPFMRSEFLKLAIASQYIEGFFRKYDANADELVNFSEALASFASFKSALLSLPQIQGTAAEGDPQTLFAVYTFFLRKGRLPNTIFGQPIELLGWLKKVERCTEVTPEGDLVATTNSQTCEFQSGRSKLMKILAFLANAI